MTKALKTGRDFERRARLTLMVVATAICVAAFPVGAIGALFSPLVFDERGNLFNPLAWLGFLLMISFWIVCLVGPLAAWIAWSRKHEHIAWTAMSAPAIWGLAMVTVLQFVPG